MTFRKWIMLLLAAAAASLPAVCQGQSDPSQDPWGVLERKIRTEGEVRLEGERQVESTASGRTLVLRQKVLRDKGNRYRIEIISPANFKGILIVSDGVSRWRYDPSAHIATQEVLPLPAEETGERLREMRDLRGRLLVGLRNGDAIAGRPTWLLTINARDTSALLRQYWVDRSTLVELKRELYAAGGTPTQRECFIAIDYDPTLSGSEFTWQPPPNVLVRRLSEPLIELPLQQAHGHVGFMIFNPPASALPTGFQLLSDRVAVFEEDQAKIAWLRFSNGMDVFSLFERRRPSFALPPRHSAISTEWVAGPLHFTLVGQMRPEHANRLRESTVRAMGSSMSLRPATR